MKKLHRITLHSILIICDVLFGAANYGLFAQTEPVTINVQTAGTLSTLLGNNLDLIEDLTLTGSLNGDDIKTIREMDKLAILDLANSQIVEGGGYYIDEGYLHLGTTNSNISRFMFRDLNISNIVLPLNTIEIELCAFKGCLNLTSITIPNSVTTIGQYAFEDCVNLTSIRVPNSLFPISPSSFFGSKGLEQIIVEDDNINYSTIDGVLFNKQLTTIIICPNKKSNSYVIPEGVTIVGDHAFIDCNNLTLIDIPNSVISVGKFAFRNCSNLSYVNLSKNTIEIGEGAFLGCEKLVEVTIPEGVTILSSRLFHNCTNLVKVKLPNSLVFIGDTIFWGTKVTSITIPENVTTIACFFAFYNWSVDNEIIEIHCNSLIPPKFNYDYAVRLDGTYQEDYYNFKGTIYVPEGTLSDYMDADVWKYFNIVEEEVTSVMVIKSEALEININPNPVSDYLTVDFTNNNKTILMEIYDDKGRIVLKKDISQENIISVKHLNPGLYFYKVNHQYEILSGKFILQ